MFDPRSAKIAINNHISGEVYYVHASNNFSLFAVVWKLEIPLANPIPI